MMASNLWLVCGVGFMVLSGFLLVMVLIMVFKFVLGIWAQVQPEYHPSGGQCPACGEVERESFARWCSKCGTQLVLFSQPSFVPVEDEPEEEWPMTGALVTGEWPKGCRPKDWPEYSACSSKTLMVEHALRTNAGRADIAKAMTEPFRVGLASVEPEDYFGYPRAPEMVSRLR